MHVGCKLTEFRGDARPAPCYGQLDALLCAHTHLVPANPNQSQESAISVAIDEALSQRAESSNTLSKWPSCCLSNSDRTFRNLEKENKMNSDQLAGKWKQMKGAAKQQWGKLTDDDLDVINGQNESLIGKLQERYGIAKEEAQKQVDQWVKSVKFDEPAHSSKR